jgi:hypothetical protein
VDLGSILDRSHKEQTVFEQLIFLF